jgi:hypothetical protein
VWATEPRDSPGSPQTHVREFRRGPGGPEPGAEPCPAPPQAPTRFPEAPFFRPRRQSLRDARARARTSTQDASRPASIRPHRYAAPALDLCVAPGYVCAGLVPGHLRQPDDRPPHPRRARPLRPRLRRAARSDPRRPAAPPKSRYSTKRSGGRARSQRGTGRMGPRSEGGAFPPAQGEPIAGLPSRPWGSPRAGPATGRSSERLASRAGRWPARARAPAPSRGGFGARGRSARIPAAARDTAPLPRIHFLEPLSTPNPRSPCSACSRPLCCS